MEAQATEATKTSTESSPILVSQLAQYYREQLNNRFNLEEKVKGSVNTISTTYSSVVDNVNMKMQVPYTYEDLNAKEDMNPYEKKVKEYGMFLGNLVTNIVVDGVDSFKIIKEKTYNYLYPSKDEMQ